MKKWSFQVIKGLNERPQIKVNFKGEERLFYLEEISVWILLNFKNCRNKFKTRNNNIVVIIVAARFNDSQRQSI